MVHCSLTGKHGLLSFWLSLQKNATLQKLQIKIKISMFLNTILKHRPLKLCKQISFLSQNAHLEKRDPTFSRRSPQIGSWEEECKMSYEKKLRFFCLYLSQIILTVLLFKTFLKANKNVLHNLVQHNCLHSLPLDVYLSS